MPRLITRIALGSVISLVSLVGFLVGTLPAFAATVTVSAGQSIQTAVNNNPTGTTFNIAAGTYHEQICPKTGDTFNGAGIGLTIIDGQGNLTYGFDGGYANGACSSNSVTIKNLSIRNMVGDGNASGNGITERPWTSSGWIIDTVESSFNQGQGFDLGYNTTIQNSLIHDNGLSAIHEVGPGYTNPVNATINNNEIYNNNASHSNPCGPTADSAGIKFDGGIHVFFTNNKVHDNYGNGLWFDGESYDDTITGNEFYNNITTGGPYGGCGSAGISIEVDAPQTNTTPVVHISNNYFHGNGNSVAIANSGNVEVFNNTFSDAAIQYFEVIFQDEGNRDPSHAGLQFRNQNNSIHNNVFALGNGAGTGGGDSGYQNWKAQNNTYQNNTYYLVSSSQQAFYNNGSYLTPAQWQALPCCGGLDAGSTFTYNGGTLPAGVGPRGGFQCLPGMTWCGGGTTTGGTTGGTSCTGAVSASGTTIPSASQIIDNASMCWTLVNGQIAKNGVIDSVTNGVILLLYYNSVVYQETSFINPATNSDYWYSWTNNTWTPIAGDPRPTTLPPTFLPCTLAYTSSTAVPAGYGAAFNLFSTGKELVLNLDCTQTTPLFTLGSNLSSQYIYKTGYVYQSSAWQPLTLTSPNPLISSSWYQNTATVSLPSLDLTQWQYAVGYVCNWTGTAWKCGCADTTCATPMWQLQAFKR